MMKIAVSARTSDIDGPVDPRFGRAAFLLIVDSVDFSYEAVDNVKNLKAFQGAGIQAATLIQEKGAEVLLTGHCGPKAFQVVDAAGIKVVNGVEGTVRKAIETFNDGKFSYASEPDVEGHW